MDIKKSIRVLCAENDISQSELLRRYNESQGTMVTIQAFNRTINNGTIKAAMLDDVLNVLGYELAIVKRE